MYHLHLGPGQHDCVGACQQQREDNGHTTPTTDEILSASMGRQIFYGLNTIVVIGPAACSRGIVHTNSSTNSNQ